jgi:hypothetical protein
LIVGSADCCSVDVPVVFHGSSEGCTLGATDRSEVHDITSADLGRYRIRQCCDLRSSCRIHRVAVNSESWR